MKENHFLDDGAYSAVQIIIETVRRRLAGEGDISIELLKQLKEPSDAAEYRLKILVSLSVNGQSLTVVICDLTRIVIVMLTVQAIQKN